MRQLFTFRRIFYILLGLISLLLSLQFHSTTGRFNWKSEIYADGAGYYAYLPVTFLYGLDYDRFPEGICDSTGYSYIDHDQKKFIDKYTCGVAAMVSPFFAGTILISNIAGLPLENGFSESFHRMADIAGVFYLLIGLFFLGEVLKRYVSAPVMYAVLLALYTGTNLFYYALRQPMMSHVYSFCMISAYLYALHSWLERKTWRTLALVAFTASFAILIRPVNGIILILLLCWQVDSFSAFTARLRLLFAWRSLSLMTVVFAVVLLPQVLYWYYMFGTPIHYSYQGESFSNWALPRFAEIWFAPLNGLFLYNPLWLVIIAGIILMIIRKEKNGILLLLFFLLASYIIAAWHSWFFGCGYGHRAFVDFLPLFAIPLGLITEKAFSKRRKILAAVAGILLVAMSYYNVRIIYAFTGCFFGSVWDWNRYGILLNRAGFCDRSDRYTYTNDFENGAITWGAALTDSVSRSYRISTRFDQGIESGCHSKIYFYEFNIPFPTRADASIYVNAPSGSTSGAWMHCRIERKDSTLFSDSCLIDPFITSAGTWCKVSGSFVFAPDMPWDAAISILVNNPGRARFYADDQKILLY